MKQVDPALLGKLRALATGNAPWPLFLWGSVGSGKTYASLGLCDFALTAAYWPVEQCCDVSMRGPDEERTRLQRELREKELFVLDEIGERDTVSDLYATTLKRVLDEREMHQHGRAIYISNLAPSHLPELFDDRIVSRLLSGTIHELKANDRRASR